MSKQRDWGGIIGIILFWGFIIGIFAWSPIETAYDNHKVTCANHTLDFTTTYQADPSMLKDDTKVVTKGQNGMAYECVKGDDTIVSKNITQEPVNEVDTYGTESADNALNDYYDRNEDNIRQDEQQVENEYYSSNACVTECMDGSCSPSTGRGTCSHHGGEAY